MFWSWRASVSSGCLSFSDVLEAILQDADMELHVLRDHAIARRDM
jgi:hypothetical protein